MKQLNWCNKNILDECYKGLDLIDFVEYKQYILEHVSFVKVLRDLNIKPVSCSTGKYTHKMTCPFKFHKNGKERTASFRLHDKKNIFTCFGCGSYGSILDFLR